MMLENQGNTQASCRLHLLDPTGRVDGDFDPPAAGVEPGASSLIRLKVHATRLQWERRSRTVQFTIDADQPGCPTASAPVTFVQASMVPERLFGRALLLLIAAAALGGLWYGMVKPAIRTAADEAVTKQLPAAIVSSTTLVVAPIVTGDSVAPTLPAQQPQSVAEGELFSKLMEPKAAAGQPASVTIDVPAGKNFNLTDVAVQNPNHDLGVAVMLNATAPLWTWSLDDITQGFSRQSLVSPIVIEGGTSLVFQVTCNGDGSQTGVCAASALVSGRLVDAVPAAVPAG
jgi:hypothetical protein